MTIQVYHADNPTFGFGPEPTSFTKVADVDLPDEDYAEVFELTNTIDHYCWENPQVTKTFAGEGCRSTSVGDRIHLSDGRVLKCCSAGWEEVAWPKTKALPSYIADAVKDGVPVPICRFQTKLLS